MHRIPQPPILVFVVYPKYIVNRHCLDDNTTGTLGRRSYRERRFEIAHALAMYTPHGEAKHKNSQMK